MKKLKIPFPIIVEGKYDKIKVSSVAEAFILTTDGFGVFNKNEKLSVIRSLAEKTPVIVLTDSDGAGKLIRSYITSSLPKERLIQLYTPALQGKEKRKKVASKEGFLGVEGIDAELIYNILKPFDAESGGYNPDRKKVTKVDFYNDGLSGRENSTERRREIAKMLSLPENMTANALLSAINILCTYEEYLEIARK